VESNPRYTTGVAVANLGALTSPGTRPSSDQNSQVALMSTHGQRRTKQGGSASWNLEDAKARFSEVVRRARQGVPQHVSVRGQDAVVVLSASDFARLAPAAASRSLAALFADGPFAQLDSFEDGQMRERVPVRDLPSFEE
jgi:prevent-host-death family protein